MTWQHRHEWGVRQGTVATRWQRRPVSSWLVRFLAVLVPVVASVAAGATLSRLLPAPDGWLGTLAWYGVVALVALTVLVAVDRVARRLLPLSMLLRLSLAFPDRAPSRMAIALRAGNARRLQGCIEEAAGGGDHRRDPHPHAGGGAQRARPPHPRSLGSRARAHRSRRWGDAALRHRSVAAALGRVPARHRQAHGSGQGPQQARRPHAERVEDRAPSPGAG